MRSGAGVAPRVALCSPGELWGGVEQQVESLARFLRDAGVPVVGVVFFDGLLRQRLQAAGIPVVLVPGNGRYDPSTILRIRAVLREHRINLLHTHGYKAAVVGGLAALLARVRHVRTEHGQIEPWTGRARLKMRINGALARAASRWLTDAVVFVSRDIRRRSGSRRGSYLEDVIYNGIEPVAAPAQVPPADLLPRGDGLFNVGIVGRISPVKGHLRLLRAASLLRHMRGLRIYVLGAGPLEAECRAFCREHDLEGTVTFLGFRPNIHDYLRQLDLLVMPSLHEGLPYTLLEAMYHKVPVVASAVGGLAEVLEHDVTGVLVPSGDEAAIAEAIEALANDPVRRRMLAANAHQAVGERFMASQMADRYLAVYDRALLRLGKV